MTHRQYLAWTAWLAGEWNNPDRHDHYLMRVAQTVAVVNAKDKKTANGLGLDQFRVEFQDGSKRTKANGPVGEEHQRNVETVNKQSALLRSTRTRGKMLPVTVRVVDQSGALVSEKEVPPEEFATVFRR